MSSSESKGWSSGVIISNCPSMRHVQVSPVRHTFIKAALAQPPAGIPSSKVSIWTAGAVEMGASGDIIHSPANAHENAFILLPIEFGKLRGGVIGKDNRFITYHRWVGTGPGSKTEVSDIQQDDEQDDVGGGGDKRDDRAGDFGEVVWQRLLCQGIGRRSCRGHDRKAW